MAAWLTVLLFLAVIREVSAVGPPPVHPLVAITLLQAARHLCKHPVGQEHHRVDGLPCRLYSGPTTRDVQPARARQIVDLPGNSNPTLLGHIDEQPQPGTPYPRTTMYDETLAIILPFPWF
ncbi:Uncharacterized protein PBTT_06662 [Plasmodiophora brassicae]